ncbi:MAG: cytochrome c [Bacteroidota bacterium]
MMRSPTLLAAVLVLAVALAGCRGMHSDKPPIHPNLNMDFQEYFEPQEANPFFADNSAMRQPVPGTVKRTGLRTTENAPYYAGRTADGALVETIPMEVSEEVLLRGQERYNIYCSVCHGEAGDGQGIIMTGNGGQGYGYTPAPSYHTDASRAYPDGYFYDAIANGIRSMPSYAHQVSVPDRWAIVAYIRALQRSQNAAAEDVPEPIRAQLETYNPNVNLD